MTGQRDFDAAQTYYQNAKEYAECYLAAMRRRGWLDAEGQMRKVCEAIYFCVCAEKGVAPVCEPEVGAAAPGDKRPRFGKTQLQHLAELIQKDGSRKPDDLARAVRLMEPVANPAAHAESRPVPAKEKAKNLLIGGRRTMRLLIEWFFQHSDAALRFGPWNPWAERRRRWLIWGGAGAGVLVVGLVLFAVIAGQQVRDLVMPEQSGVEVKQLQKPLPVVRVSSTDAAQPDARAQRGQAAVSAESRPDVTAGGDSESARGGSEPMAGGRPESSAGGGPASAGLEPVQERRDDSQDSAIKKAAEPPAAATSPSPPVPYSERSDGLGELSAEHQTNVYEALEAVKSWYGALGVDRDLYFGLMHFPMKCYYGESDVPEQRLKASRDGWFDGTKSGRPLDFGWPVRLAWARDDEVALVITKPGTEAVLDPKQGASRKGLLVRRIDGRWLIAAEISLSQNGRKRAPDDVAASISGPCLPGIFEAAQGRKPLWLPSSPGPTQAP